MIKNYNSAAIHATLCYDRPRRRYALLSVERTTNAMKRLNLPHPSLCLKNPTGVGDAEGGGVAEAGARML